MSRVEPPFTPDPPDFTRVAPIIQDWPARREILRVHNLDHPPNRFNPGERTEPRGRFHFFEDVGGARVPVLYGAKGEDAAIAETVFHDARLGPDAVVPERRLARLGLARLRPRRDLHLVELLGHGLRRLGLRARNLTDTDAIAYPRTVAWARALHAALPDIDGLLWMSRQFNAENALVLYGDRVAETDLEVVARPQPLFTGAGRHVVEVAAARAGVTII